MTKSPEAAKTDAEYVVIGFEKGEPVSVNGERLNSVALLTELNRMGGEHGVGRVDLVENRFVGMKSRGVYETPGVTILQAAHRAVESITMDREVVRLRDALSLKFAESVYYGFWFAPETELMRRTIDATQETVTGEARVKLYRGNCTVVGRRAPRSLYNERLATFEADTIYNQRDAEGFIKLNALRLRSRAQLERSGGEEG
jgi:argininosuccinate synthase